MNVCEQLIAARAKIEQGWCQHAYAKDADGEATSRMSPQAVSWCMTGALRAVAPDEPAFEARDAPDAAVRLSTGDDVSLVEYNDSMSRTKQEVLAVYDKAIELTRRGIV